MGRHAAAEAPAVSARQRKADGTLVVTVHLTLKPGRDEALIALVQAAPHGGLAGAIREAMRHGVTEDTPYAEEVADDLALAISDLGFVL